MALMLVAMVVSVFLGMVFRKLDGVWRILVLLLSVGVTSLYFVFADALM